MTLVLDAGALISVERGDRMIWLRLEAARQAGEQLVVPAAVVGQAWRRGAQQTRLARLLKLDETEVEPLTESGAKKAGLLCGKAGTADVIDATVALAAQQHRGRVITSDRADIKRLDPRIPIIDC